MRQIVKTVLAKPPQRSGTAIVGLQEADDAVDQKRVLQVTTVCDKNTLKFIKNRDGKNFRCNKNNHSRRSLLKTLSTVDLCVRLVQ